MSSGELIKRVQEKQLNMRYDHKQSRNTRTKQAVASLVNITTILQVHSNSSPITMLRVPDLTESITVESELGSSHFHVSWRFRNDRQRWQTPRLTKLALEVAIDCDEDIQD